MPDGQTQPNPTRDLAAWAAALRPDGIDDAALRWARHCLLDWLAVTLPGAHEPLVGMLVAEALEDGAAGPLALPGRAESLSPSWWVLTAGSASHALDYDDVNMAMLGHTTVAVMPAVLAAGAASGRSLDDVLRAFVTGYEMACRIGTMTGEGHYNQGWHATGTIGTFGAAAGTGWLLGLDADRMAHALGIAATKAAGLKGLFGTMCKPLHAGRAAQSGYLAARYASRGWVARDDALDCPQGFWAVQGPGAAARPVAEGPFLITRNLFKYHAACYMTHSMIDACGALRARGIDPARVTKVTLRCAEPHLKICNIARPATGLEIKFSLRHLAAMALSGEGTGGIDAYTDAMAARPDLVALQERVVVEARPAAGTAETGAEVTVTLDDGTVHEAEADVGVPATDLDRQEARLCAKFDGLATPVLGDRAEALKAIALEATGTAQALLEAARAGD